MEKVFQCVFLIILIMFLVWLILALLWPFPLVISDSYVGIVVQDDTIVQTLPPGKYPPPKPAGMTIVSRDVYDEALKESVYIANHICSMPGGEELDHARIAERIATGIILGKYDDVYNYVHSILWSLNFQDDILVHVEGLRNRGRLR